jgi:hypothetical protein
LRRWTLDEAIERALRRGRGDAVTSTSCARQSPPLISKPDRSHGISIETYMRCTRLQAQAAKPATQPCG